LGGVQNTPQVLLKNAQDFDGNPSAKRDLYEEYNTIGFEGGESIMEYTWGLGDGKEKTNQGALGFTTNSNEENEEMTVSDGIAPPHGLEHGQ
jgi:hypothetical protein